MTPVSRERSVRQQYDEQGVVIVRDAVALDWVAQLRAGIASQIRSNDEEITKFVADGAEGHSLSCLSSWTRIEPYKRFLLKSELSHLVLKCRGEDRVHLVEDQWFAKEPGATNPTPFHEDQSFFEIDTPLTTAWIALDHIPIESSLQFVIGSHQDRCNYLPEHLHNQLLAEDKLPPDHMSAEVGIRNRDLRAWAVEPGDCLLFDARILHGGAPNRADCLQRRFASRWASGSARVARTGYPWSGLPRGEQSDLLADGMRLCSELFPVISSTEGNT